LKCRKNEGDDIMERKALLLFSHQLTENWSNVSIKKNYKKNLEKIKKYIEENFNENDVMLVQGNWGYTYNIVKWSIEKKLVPVYSYTERNVEEIKDGENVKKISYFKHVKFIEYE